MKTVILVIVLALSTFVKANVVCGSSDDYPSTWTTTDRYAMTSKLFEWCQNDPTCSILFQQSTHANFTVFNYLVRNIVGSTESLLVPFKQLVCNNYTESQVIENVWMLILQAEASMRPTVCDWNHDLSVDLDGLVANCVCQADQMCASSKAEMRGILTMIIIAAVLAGIIIIVLLYGIFTDLKAFKRASSRELMSIIKRTT